MKIEIKEIVTYKDLEKFIKFPLNLYKDNEYYVPPLINEEFQSLDKNKNPVFEYSQAYYFLAYKGTEIVGRIAAIINNNEIKKQHKPKIRFGWFDVIDDINVTKALLDKVAEIGKRHNLKYMEGPVGFSNLEKAGLLTEGFTRMATMLTLYNHKYYKTHFEQLGFITANEWIENYFTISDKLPEKITKFSKIIQKRYNLNVIRFSSGKDMQPYIRPMFDLLIETYSSLESFVPFSEKQIEYYSCKYLKILKPEFVNCITDENGNLCSFAITSLSYAKALKKANGKLFPFGWYHLLQASRKSDTAEHVLIGVHPKYQKKGITSIIFTEIFRTFKKYNIKHIETNPQLIENLNVQLLWDDFNPIIHKKRKTFSKSIL